MTEQEPIEAAMIFSGTGTTVQHVVAESQPGKSLDGLVRPVVGIATNKKAYDNAIEKDFGLPVELIRRGQFHKGEEGDELYGIEVMELLDTEQYSGANTLLLLGCLAKISKRVLGQFPERAGNMHPGTLDPGRDIDFGGQYMIGDTVIRAQIMYSWIAQLEDPETHAIFHHADSEYDEGDIISYRSMPLPFLEGDRVTIADFHDDKELRQYLEDQTKRVQEELKPLERKNVVSALFSLGRNWNTDTEQAHKFPHMRWPEPMFPPEHAGIIYDCKQASIEFSKH